MTLSTHHDQQQQYLPTRFTKGAASPIFKAMTSLRKLFERRVPQYLALYLGVAWGLVQFVSFLEERYALSPHWTDLALLTFGLLIPSVALFAYNHGKPGKDEWTRSEKVGIPLNLVLAVAVLFEVFADKDLSAVVTRVRTRDESGKEVSREVAKASYRQRVVLFNLEGPAEDTTVAWLRYGLPLGTAMDLMQDMFIDLRSSAHFSEKLRELGFPQEVGVPGALKRQIAQQGHITYYTDGTVSRNAGQINVDLGLYESASGKLVERKQFAGTDVLPLIDELSKWVKDALDVPETDLVKDLPVSDILTASVPAFREWVGSVTALTLESNWQRGQQHLEQATTIDPTFAFAWLGLHNVLLVSNQGSKALPPLQKAMDHNYRLPERIQHDVRAEYYMVTQDAEKAFNVAKMKVDLYPQDINAHLMMATFYAMRDDKDGMINSFKKVLELDPTQHEQLQQLGKLYEAKGDYENALRSYTQYGERFPNNKENFIATGKLQQRRGKPDLARADFDRALLVAPNDALATTAVAVLERDLGNFDAAERQLQNALRNARTDEARTNVLQELADYYDFRGQYGRSTNYTEQFIAEMSKRQPALVTAINQLQMLDRYVRAGQMNRGRQILAQLRTALQPPYDGLINMGELELALEARDAAGAERWAAAVEQVIKALGMQGLNSPLTMARGRIAEIRNDCPTALKYYEAKQKLDPADYTSNVSIGRCHRLMTQPQKAIEMIQKTLAIVPAHGRANYEIALAYLDAGDRAKAVEHLQRAVQTWSAADPSFRTAADAKAKLREIGE